jgi:hypothetical protein
LSILKNPTITKALTKLIMLLPKTEKMITAALKLVLTSLVYFVTILGERKLFSKYFLALGLEGQACINIRDINLLDHNFWVWTLPKIPFLCVTTFCDF